MEDNPEENYTEKFEDGKLICNLCDKRLVAIGHSRKNGKPHPDWPSRSYHKKCWLTREKFFNHYNVIGKNIIIAFKK